MWDICSDVPCVICVHFVGPVPDLSQLQSLQYLDLADNELSGKVNIFGTSPVVSHSDSHFFAGEIPKSVGGCTALQRLHLSWNQLEGRSCGTFAVMSRVTLCLCM